MDKDVSKTVFRTRYRYFEYLIILFVLTNTLSLFIYIMNDIFRHYLDRSVIVFLDDILIYSKTLEDHKKYLQEVLQTLREKSLYTKVSKCEFGRSEVDYLGQCVSAKEIQVMSDKIQVIQKGSAPKDQTQLKKFLGLIDFYCRFVKSFARMLQPLIALFNIEQKG